MRKEGSQLPLSINNDRDIRRLVIKDHLCGVAVCYEPHTIRRNEVNTRPGRPQGSHYSQQKRKIANACEWMRLNAIHKPRIFVATSTGFNSFANETGVIKNFTHNLRNGYKCKNYVWVREYTKEGFPHFHFVADLPEIDFQQMSLYWSGLLNSDAKNSVRFGTAPRCSKCGTKLKEKNQACYKSGCLGSGKVDYWIKGPKMSWYMTKYISKSVGDQESFIVGVQPDYETYQEYRINLRTFAVSQKLAQASLPLLYEEKIILSQTYEPGKGWGRSFSQRSFELNEEQAEPYYDLERSPPLFNPKTKRWSWTGHGNTFIGRPKNWKTT